MRISDLKAGMRQVNLKAKVVNVSEPREVRTRFGWARVADAVIEDETGQAKMSLWNQQINMVAAGDEIIIENGYTTEFRGEVQLNVGKYGKLKKVG